MKTNPSSTWFIGSHLVPATLASTGETHVTGCGATWGTLESVGSWGGFTVFLFCVSFWWFKFFTPPKKKRTAGITEELVVVKMFFPVSKGPFSGYMFVFRVQIYSMKRESHKWTWFFWDIWNEFQEQNRFRMEGFLYKQIYSPKTNTELWKSPMLKGTLSSKPPWLCSMLFFSTEGYQSAVFKANFMQFSKLIWYYLM